MAVSMEDLGWALETDSADSSDAADSELQGCIKEANPDPDASKEKKKPTKRKLDHESDLDPRVKSNRRSIYAPRKVFPRYERVENPVTGEVHWTRYHVPALNYLIVQQKMGVRPKKHLAEVCPVTGRFVSSADPDGEIVELFELAKETAERLGAPPNDSD